MRRCKAGAIESLIVIQPINHFGTEPMSINSLPMMTASVEFILLQT